MTPLIAMPAWSRSESVELDQAVAAGSWPALPVLSSMLQGATRLPAAADWRSGVLAAIAVPASVDTAPANIAARAIPVVAEGAGICLAMAVHAVAGISRMFLGGGGSFTLDRAERDALRLAFNAEFGGLDVQLHPAGSGWVLQAPFAMAANDGSPELLLGAALTRTPAGTAPAKALRRLGAEVEIWLARLPLNREREKRGEPPINCMWFWNGAVARPLQPPGRVPGGMFTNIEPDPWVAGLARHCGTPAQHACAWNEVRDTAGALVILQPAALGDALQQFAAWEADWLEPARRDLASRRLPALRLQIGRSAWQLPGPRLTRWLRRSRPWWQSVSA